jgi:PAS domain S-box-containing protein
MIMNQPGIATELKPVRRALMREWDSYFTHLPVAALLANARGQVLLASDVLARMLGCGMPSLIAAELSDLFPLEHKLELAKLLRSAREHGAHSCECDVLRGDGSRFHAKLDASVVRDEWGGVRAIVLHVHELTRELEAAKRHVELDTLRAVVNNLPVVLFALDRKGRFVLSEGGGLSALGLKPGEVVGSSALERYHDIPWIVDGIRRALAGEAATDVGPIGDLVFQATYTPTRDREGTTTGVLGLGLDVTRRARSEQEKQVLIEQLHEALQLRDEFLSIASHELRTPLSTLTLKLELLLSRARAAGAALSAEQVVTQAEQLMRLCARMTRLIDGLLDVSRVATGRLVLELEAFDLTQMVAEVSERMRAQFERAGRALVLQPAPSAPGEWDRTRLEQVLENFLTNALKHGAGRVDVSVQVEPARATIVVSDRGPGIALDQQERIFERFARAAPKGRGGLGLGLYISRQIVEAHGGSVHVESAPGTGTAFSVTLPRRTPVHAEG